jgi:hypothetical protein
VLLPPDTTGHASGVAVQTRADTNAGLGTREARSPSFPRCGSARSPPLPRGCKCRGGADRRLDAGAARDRHARKGLAAAGCRHTTAPPTHSAVSPRAADGCIVWMMRKPNGARLTSDAALLLLLGIGLLVRHEQDRQLVGVSVDCVGGVCVLRPHTLAVAPGTESGRAGAKDRLATIV